MAPKVSKEKKQPTPSPHPPYLVMISEAILSLNERSGSSQPAIAKYLEERYKTHLPPNFRKILSIQLKRLAKSEKLFKVKNSYKLSITKKPTAIGAATKKKVTTTTAAVAAVPKKKVVKGKMSKADETENDKTKKKMVIIVDARVKKGKAKATKAKPKASPKKTTKSLKVVKTTQTKKRAGKTIKSPRKAVAVMKAKK